jgi:hypothetical protein
VVLILDEYACTWNFFQLDSLYIKFLWNFANLKMYDKVYDVLKTEIEYIY